MIVRIRLCTESDKKHFFFYLNQLKNGLYVKYTVNLLVLRVSVPLKIHINNISNNNYLKKCPKMNKHRSVVGQWVAYLSRRSFGQIM